MDIPQGVDAVKGINEMAEQAHDPNVKFLLYAVILLLVGIVTLAVRYEYVLSRKNNQVLDMAKELSATTVTVIAASGAIEKKIDNLTTLIINKK